MKNKKKVGKWREKGIERIEEKIMKKQGRKIEYKTAKWKNSDRRERKGKLWEKNRGKKIGGRNSE